LFYGFGAVADAAPFTCGCSLPDPAPSPIHAPISRAGLQTPAAPQLPETAQELAIAAPDIRKTIY
jgi:hypothetical protein